MMEFVFLTSWQELSCYACLKRGTNTFGEQNFLPPWVNTIFMVNVDAHLSNENAVKYLKFFFSFSGADLWTVRSKAEIPVSHKPVFLCSLMHTPLAKKNKKTTTTIHLFTCTYTHTHALI